MAEVNRQLNGRFLACSRQLIAEIEAGGVTLGSRVEVVPNWVTGDPTPARTSYYRVGSGRPLRIMAAGQINRNKGVDILIEAAALVRSAGFEDFTLDLFGQADDPFFAALAKSRGLDRHVRFLGSRPQGELVREYAEHDLFAFPTWHREPFAFAPLEASWRGCVPLMSQLSGNAEWAVHGVHCLKADRGPGAFAESVIAILDGSTDLEPLARRAAAVIGRDFQLATVLPTIERSLSRAGATSGGRRGSVEEVYRMALLAEKLSRVLVGEMVAAA